MSVKPNGYAIRTYAVEYLVPGGLDGLTLGPPLNGAPVQNPPDPQQLFRPPVPGDLGLIDVDYVVEENLADRRGAKGNRYISWLWIESPTPGAADAAIEVVDIVDGTVAVQEVIATPVGDTLFYTRRGILIPQGSVLRLRGFPGGGAVPIKVRMHIQYLTDEGWLMAQKAVCACEGNGGGGGAGVDDLDLEWGVQNLAGAGANPRYLWPGSGRTVAQPELIERPASANSLLRAIIVQHNNPIPPPVLLTYEVLVNGAVVAGIIAPVSSGVVSSTGLAGPAAQGDTLAIRVTRNGDHPTLVGVLVSTLWERT